MACGSGRFLADLMANKRPQISAGRPGYFPLPAAPRRATSMSIQRLRIEKRYSEIVIQRHRPPGRASWRMTTDGDIRAADRETLANIDRYLAEAGSDKTKILSGDHLPRTWRRLRRHERRVGRLGAGRRPARAPPSRGETGCTTRACW